MSQQLFNEDCLDVISRMLPNSIDLVVTDPPYGISKGKTTITFKGKRTDIQQNFGEWDVFDTEEDFVDFATKWLSAVYRVLKPHHILCFFWSIKKLSLAERLIQETGFLLKDYFFKVTSNPCPAFRKAGFWAGVEPVLICQKVEPNVKPKTPPFNRDITGMSNYVRCGIVSGRQRTIHPTQKPTATIEPLITYYSKQDDWVLDPFMGSGTTGIVCKQWRTRNFIGIEKNETYFKIAKERLES